MIRESETDTTTRIMEVWFYYPTDGESGFWLDAFGAFYNAAPMTGDTARPLFIFAHGGCGHPLQSTYLYQHLASWGFIVLCTQHPGSVWGNPDCLTADVLTDTWYNRPGDVEYSFDSVLALSLAEPNRWGVIDTSRVLMSGHSFGARTSYAVANRYDFADAILAFSGDYIEVSGADMNCMEDIRGIDIPIMIMGGTLDYGLEPDHFHEVFDTLEAPKYGVLLNRGGHLAYGDSCNVELDAMCATDLLLPQDIGHEIILHYSMSFIFKYILGDNRWEENLYEDYDTLAEIFYDEETVVEESPFWDIDHSSIHISPNPFRERFNLKSSRDGKIELYDINGRIIATKTISDETAEFHLPDEEYAAGLYFIKITRLNDHQVIPALKVK